MCRVMDELWFDQRYSIFIYFSEKYSPSDFISTLKYIYCFIYLCIIVTLLLHVLKSEY